MTAHAAENVGCEQHSFIAGGMQTCADTTEISVAALGRLGIDLPLLLLGVYPKDSTFYHRDTCSSMIIALLYIIATNWKQPRCPSTDEWIR